MFRRELLSGVRIPVYCSLLLLLTCTVCCAADESVYPVDNVDKFFEQFHPSDGIYYLVSSHALVTRNNRDYFARTSLKQVGFGKDFVVVYTSEEEITGELTLADSNVSALEKLFSADVLGSRSTVGPFANVASFAVAVQLLKAMCHVDVTGAVPTRIATGFFAKRLTLIQFCSGFGVMAALSGFKIVANKTGVALEFTALPINQ